MTLRFFESAQKWAFALGGKHPVQLDGAPMFFATFDDALRAAARRGYTVGPWHHVERNGKATFTTIKI